MGLLNFGNPMNGGLLGLGGLSGGSQDQMASLLGQYYDAGTAKKRKIKAALLGAAQGLMSSPDWGSGLSQGFQSASDEDAAYRQEAMQNFSLAEEIRRRKLEEARQARQDAWSNTQNQHQLEDWQRQEDQYGAQQKFLQSAPSDQRDFAAAFPDQYAKQKADAMFPNSPSNGGAYFGTPLPLQDKNGNFIGYGLPGRDGSFKTLQPGENYQFMGPYDKSFQQHQGSEMGDASGKAMAAAPSDIQAGMNALDYLQQIEQNPYLERGTGLSSYGNMIPGTGGYDFQNIVNQAKSGAFLSAIQQMRGMGSLSNAEGEAATAAVTRLDTATSKEAFLAALADYKKIVMQGIMRAQARLGQNRPDSPQDTKQPTLDELLNKYGG